LVFEAPGVIPFFVVDRPMSLNIVKTFFAKHPGIQFGLMSHGLVSENFKTLFSSFPCQPADCWLCGRDANGRLECGSRQLRSQLQASVLRIVDCGIFSKEKQPRYPELYDVYESMNADYGVMKDVFGDAKKTIESAKRAVEVYLRRKRRFRLVLVAQGKNAEEYLWCSEKLSALGVGELAVGGLLVRKERSARYASAGTMERIDEILTCLRRRFPRRWLFVLGCYHPRRHSLFEKHGVFGSDYKGWIFNYKHRFDQIAEASRALSAAEEDLAIPRDIAVQVARRQKLGDKASKLRTAYATTKNSSPKNSLRKAEYRQALVQVLNDVECIDRELVRLRGIAVSSDGLPGTYKEAFFQYQKAVLESDQSVRVTEVHRYLSAEVLPKMAGGG
jgi:hypothetical protein